MSVSDINPNDLKNISITKIQVVYLIDENITPVLQPVYLLEGNIELTGTDAKKALIDYDVEFVFEIRRKRKRSF